MKKILITFVILAVIVAAVGYKIFYIQPPVIVTKAVDIPASASLHKISYILVKEGILRHRRALIVLAKLKGASHKAQSGEFLFPVPASPENILEILLHGTPVLHQVTIPEGFNLKEMAPLFEAENIISAQDFLNASRDINLLKTLLVPGKNFEGYLFPSTYHFPKNEKAANIFQLMNEELKKNIQADDLQKARKYGWSLHQWITLASIIEKETGNSNEYELVSSVFHNRLNKKMRLQSDPTVIYGIENYAGNIKKIHLQTDTPYNTYTRGGIPIGPIASPGAKALHAAVNPAQTDYLFFVANPTTKEHVFTKTYKDHLAAVQKYQLNQ
jgi:UPF0755 protein